MNPEAAPRPASGSESTTATAASSVSGSRNELNSGAASRLDASRLDASALDASALEERLEERLEESLYHYHRSMIHHSPEITDYLSSSAPPRHEEPLANDHSRQSLRAEQDCEEQQQEDDPLERHSNSNNRKRSSWTDVVSSSHGLASALMQSSWWRKSEEAAGAAGGSASSPPPARFLDHEYNYDEDDYSNFEYPFVGVCLPQGDEECRLRGTSKYKFYQKEPWLNLVRKLEAYCRIMSEGSSNEEDPDHRMVRMEIAARVRDFWKEPDAYVDWSPMELQSRIASFLTLPDELQTTSSVLPVIVQEMENGMMQGIDRLIKSAKTHVHKLKALLVFLECPLWEKPSNGDSNESNNSIFFDRHGTLLSLWCETALDLDWRDDHAALCQVLQHRFQDHPERFIQRAVRPLLYQLQRAISDKTVLASTRMIPAIAKVLYRFHQATLHMTDNSCHFYYDHASTVSKREMEFFYQDLQQYKAASASSSNSPKFCFCASAQFLFSPTMKRNLLQMENQMQMIHVAADGATLCHNLLKWNPNFILKVKRTMQLNEISNLLQTVGTETLRKRLRVLFQGEEGIDSGTTGGVSREFFQWMSSRLWQEQTNLWCADSHHLDQVRLAWFNANCCTRDNIAIYHLTGILCGLSAYHGVPMDVHFPRVVYKKLLQRPLTLEDVWDDQLRASLQQLLDYPQEDVQDIYGLAFEVYHPPSRSMHPLKPGGSDIPVTSSNKREYVQLYIDWLLNESVAAQYETFQEGFLQVMGNCATLQFLSPQELELIIVGKPGGGIGADKFMGLLSGSVQYEGGYEKDSPVITNFWNCIQAFDETQRENFLMFVTGSSRIPLMGGLPSFKIQKAGADSSQLPSAHTCFNTLLLPDYGENFEKLQIKLCRAIEECKGFGLQ